MTPDEDLGRRAHHPDCPALYFTDHPARCRCIFLAVLDKPRREQPHRPEGAEVL